ncbi:MAG: PIN domain-containing protein [Acidobacteriota bacterium]
MAHIAMDGQEILVWWGSEVECASAVARLERSGHLTAAESHGVFEALDEFSNTWSTVDALEMVRRSARRLLRVHDLRAADALQLAAALAASEGQPASLEFVCLDERLVAAAQREGFRVIDGRRLGVG